VRDDATFHTWDDYYIPGTRVLRNKFTTLNKPFGETDPEKLRVMEETINGLRVQ